MESFCRSLPKVELHMHLEGSLQPELVRKIAQRNGLLDQLPPEPAFFAEYKEYQGLLNFLQVYYSGAGVLRTRQDFFDMTWAYALRAASEDVVHLEPFIDVEHHLKSSIPLETMLGEIEDALRKAEAELAISSRLIVCFQRPFGPAHALGVLDQLAPFVASGLVAAIGTDSDYTEDWPAL
jgi:adenosine deaminase